MGAMLVWEERALLEDVILEWTLRQQWSNVEGLAPVLRSICKKLELEPSLAMLGLKWHSGRSSSGE